MPPSKLLPDVTFEKCTELMVKLSNEHNLVTALTVIGKRPWIRLSANVYNEQSDYVKLRDRLAKAFKFNMYI